MEIRKNYFDKKKYSIKKNCHHNFFNTKTHFEKLYFKTYFLIKL